MPDKNDHLSKLFQKAARDYPLKTDNSNWDDVSAKLKNAAKSEAARKKRWKYPVILLLFAVGSMILYKFQSYNNQVQQQQIPGKKVSKQNSDIKSDKPDNNVLTVIEDLKAAETKQATFKGKELSIASTSIEVAMHNDYYNHSMMTAPLLNFNDLTVAENRKQVEKVPDNDTYVRKESTLKPDRKLIPDNKMNEDVQYISAKEKKALKIQLKPAYRIYGVLFGGAKLSTVKFQQIEEPGYRMGVGIGYKINNSFSIELGLQREHINFYTDGRYIDTSMLRIKSNVDIESVNASSKITSVPLTLRYHFPSRSKGHFFVSAGSNAVVITHSEKYKYSVSKNGVQNNLSKSYSALREPKYFSGVNLSAGYEAKLCRQWSVKVEPYYQTPVHDFGVGRLPVTSFGIDVGIIKDLK